VRLPPTEDVDGRDPPVALRLQRSHCTFNAVIISVVNTKGGSGRTTVAVNLAAALAGPTRRVLLVDVDSQALASLWCGIPRRALLPSIASCLLEDYPIAKAIRRTPTPQLDLLTGSIELANADVALSHKRSRERALRRTLQRLDGRYDLIVLDSGPGMSLLAVNVIVAADAIVVPVIPEALCVDALSTLEASFERVRMQLGSSGRILGVVLTMIEPRRMHCRELADRVRAQFRDKVFDTEIRWTSALANAPAQRKNILAAAPRSTSADAFRRLAGEVLRRLTSIRH
jgi:chromosome partitioning protein